MRTLEQFRRLRRFMGRGKRVGIRLAKRWRGTSTRPTSQREVAPVLSIIVPMYGVEKYLSDCLESLSEQTYSNLEFVLVDDCSPDRSLAIAREFAGRDNRFTVLALKQNVGLSDARNAGIDVSTGDYIAFLDSDDYIKPGAYADAMATLIKSGSDFAVLGYWRFNSARRWGAAPWIRSVHAMPRLACSPSDFPDMQMNAVAWSKVYRRDFWDRAGLRFPSGRKYEDQPVSALAYSTATHVDILAGSHVGWRDREDGTSISQQVHTVPDLQARLDAARDSLKIMAERGANELAQHRQAQLLANDFPHSLQAVPRSSQEFFDVLHFELRDLLSCSEDWLWDRMSPQVRVAYELLMRNDRARLIDFYESGGGNLKNFKTFVDRNGIYAKLPYFDDETVGIGTERFRLIARQTELQTNIFGFRRDIEGQRIIIDGWAYFDNVDSVENPYDLFVYIENSRTGETITLDIALASPSDISEVTKHKWCNYENAAFRATLDLFLLPALTRSEEWRLMVQATAGPLKETVEIRGLRRTGSAGQLGAIDLVGGGRMLCRRSAGGGLEFLHYRPFCSVTAAEVAGRGVRLSLDAHKNASFVVAHNPFEDLEVRSEILHDEGGAYVIIELPPMGVPLSGLSRGLHGTWNLRAGRFTGKKRSPIAWRMDSEAYGAELHTRISSAGNLQLVEARRELLVKTAKTVDSALLLDVESASAALGEVTISALGPKLATYAHVSPKSKAFEVKIDLEASSFGLGKLPLPPGKYGLSVQAAGPDPVLRPSVDLLNELPLELFLDNMRARLDIDRSGQLCIDVRLPLRREERGNRHQRELQQWHADSKIAVDPGTFLFRSYYGENSACNPGAVAKYLASHAKAEQIYVAVRDLSVAVPDGCIPVVHESKEWYGLLSSAEVIMDNMHQPIYHVKNIGQKVIESFHGYPFKEMGHPHWNHLGFTRQRISSFDRRAAEWDYLVSPASYATPLLRRDFRYEGEVLESGYPRNDVLFGPEASSIRTDTRKRLGISPQQQVVLYAPTFRDYLSLNDSSAPMVDFLDLDSLTGTLGEDNLFLIRGHAFNARSGSLLDLTEYPNMIDVTDYADVADLYLAADVLVADYSSLRFDFALTGKPMIFFVPDLDLYRADRSWLMPFDETAPGPLARTTEEVIFALQDIERVRDDYREDYQKFTENYLDLDDGSATKRLVESIEELTTHINHNKSTADERAS